MGVDWIHELKVAELKDELKKRGQPVSGKKAELAERLEAYVKENEATPDGDKPTPAEERAEEAAAPEAAAVEGRDKGEEQGKEEEQQEPEKEPAGEHEEPAKPAADTDVADQAAGSEEPEVMDEEGAAPAVATEDQQEEEDQPGLVAGGSLGAAEPVGEEEGRPAAEAEEDADAETSPAAPQQAEQDQQLESPAAAAAEAAPTAPAEGDGAAAAMEEDRVELDYGESDHEEPQQEKLDKRGDRAAEAGGHRKRDREAASGTDRRAAATAAAAAAGGGGAERPAKVVRRDSGAGTAADVGERPAPEDVPAAQEPTTRALRIDNLVRPFLEGQLRALLNNYGFVKAMWMPSIKTHCYAVFENKGQAEAARRATWRLQWPATNPKRLAPRFVALVEAEEAIARGSGNPEFKVARTEEDGEDAAAPAAAAKGARASEARNSSGRDGDAAAQAVDKRLVERRRSREWNRERPPEGEEEPPPAALLRGSAAAGGAPGEPAGPAVRDLRDMLSSRRPGGLERGSSRNVMDRLDGRRGDPREHPHRPAADDDRRPLSAPMAAPVREPSPEPVRGLSLDELFRKTETKPFIYWLPLTEEQVAAKKQKAAEAATAAAQQGVPPPAAANGPPSAENRH
ncbi:hypothetical protein N2152v2_009449 [Parachlorella kessleri]